jgi:iron(III) transport system ATP-binding protein
VAYPLRVRRVPRKTIAQKVLATLALVGLEGLESRPATQLSGGQQQRVALARAIVFEPRLLLLDEPLSNLDAKLRVHMRAELKRLQQATGITSIFVTHDQGESMALADRIIVMNGGHIEQVGTPADIYERPRSRFVSEFVGSINVLHGLVTGVVDGRVALRLGDREVFGHAAVETTFADGEAVMATVRPEKLVLSPVPVNGGANSWEGRVASVAYFGDHREYEVEVSEERLKVTTPASLSVEQGSRVFVTCDPSEVIVIGERRP